MTEEIHDGVYEISENYWLGSSFVHTSAGNAIFGVRYVYVGGVYGNYLYNSNDGYSGGNNGVRPVVFLKSDIQIIIETEGGTKSNPWKFYLQNDTEGETTTKAEEGSASELTLLFQQAEELSKKQAKIIQEQAELCQAQEEVLQEIRNHLKGKNI